MKNSSKFFSGEMILIKFPFTDLTASKIRPALVVANQHDQDLFIAPISTTVNAGRHDIILQPDHYAKTPLPITSCVRYQKLFTLNQKLVLKKIGSLKPKILKDIKQKIVKYILD